MTRTDATGLRDVIARVRAGLLAMGQRGDCLDVRLMQFVTLYRGGEKVQMSTRVTGSCR